MKHILDASSNNFLLEMTSFKHSFYFRPSGTYLNMHLLQSFENTLTSQREDSNEFLEDEYERDESTTIIVHLVCKYLDLLLFRNKQNSLPHANLYF